ncbi:MAG: hypothetical protein QM775_29950 [Pirellulales bacterium]
MHRRLANLAGFALLFPLTSPLSAHEDQRLNAALEGDAQVRRQYHVATLSAQLANQFAGIKEQAIADELLKQSQQACDGITNDYVKQAITGDNANELSSNDIEGALKMLNSISDDEVWVKTVWKLARRLEKQDRAKTLELFQECIRRSRGVTDAELRAELISGTGANLGKIDRAAGTPLVHESHELAKQITDPFERCIMLNEVGAHLMDVGDRDGAIAVFDEVDRIVDTIADPLQQAKVLVMLGGEQAEKDLKDRAAAALEKCVVVAAKIPDGEPRNAVLSETARNFGQAFRFERGIEVAKSIADPYHRAEGYIRIAKNYSRNKQPDVAVALLQETATLVDGIEDPYNRGLVLRKLASELRDLKQAEQVCALLDKASVCLAGIQAAK